MATIRELLRNKFLNPIFEFLHDSRAVGIVLFSCTLISLVVSNIPGGAGYVEFWNSEVHLTERLHLPHTLSHWINDLLMAVFFLLVGMEIKRELLVGELSSFKKSLLPISAAVGGMLVPAVFYLCFNQGSMYQHGWGIPMATDIAFSLGVASLLGKRVPFALKVFLMALAIIDDLGAILVIALFYGGEVNWFSLLGAAGVCGILGLLNYFKVRFGLIQFLLGLVLWYFVFNSGVHATIAGVIFAMFVPVSRLPKLEHALHDPVNFIILPVFALAATAIIIPANFSDAITSTLSWGIIVGLVVGKPIGITFMSWLMVKLGLGEKPNGVSWSHIGGVGALAGIGFTMSIFIATLAFAEKEVQDVAKIAILVASLLAVFVGIIWLRLLKPLSNSETEDPEDSPV